MVSTAVAGLPVEVYKYEFTAIFYLYVLCIYNQIIFLWFFQFGLYTAFAGPFVYGTVVTVLIK